MRYVPSLIASFFLLVACGSSPAVDTDTAQESGACPATLRQAAAPGATCTTATDCSAFCCSCTSGSNQFAAAACIDGTCEDATITCDEVNRDPGALCQ